jgi:hypothetical protein
VCCTSKFPCEEDVIDESFGRRQIEMACVVVGRGASPHKIIESKAVGTKKKNIYTLAE